MPGRYVRECVSGRGSAKTLRYCVPGMEQLEWKDDEEIQEMRLGQGFNLICRASVDG